MKKKYRNFIVSVIVQTPVLITCLVEGKLYLRTVCILSYFDCDTTLTA